jgi:hypothetical protein
LGRKRSSGNERLGEYVQRRSGGNLEQRLPVPDDVRHAFPDRLGQPRKYVITSLGTQDVKLANGKADVLRARLRDSVRRSRSTRSSVTDIFGEKFSPVEVTHIARLLAENPAICLRGEDGELRFRLFLA